MQGCGDEPEPEVEELKERFGDNAAEYAKVRATAAAKAGSPDTAAWDSAAHKLLVEAKPASKQLSG
jgi:hypothetical protein